MYDIALADKHYLEMKKIIDFFINPNILSSDNFFIKNYLLHYEHSGPQIEFEYVKDNKNGSNSVNFSFYKRKATDKFWILDVRDDIIPLLKNIPNCDKSLEMLLDIHYMYKTLTSLTSSFKLEQLNDRDYFKKSVAELRNIDNCEIIPSFVIDPISMKIIKVNYQCGLFDIEHFELLKKPFTFFSYSLEYDFTDKHTKLIFNQNECKTSQNSKKITNVKKEVFKESDDQDFYINFKRSLTINMFNKIVKILDTPIDKIKLRDLEYLILLSY